MHQNTEQNTKRCAWCGEKIDKGKTKPRIYCKNTSCRQNARRASRRQLKKSVQRREVILIKIAGNLYTVPKAQAKLYPWKGGEIATEKERQEWLETYKTT